MSYCVVCVTVSQRTPSVVSQLQEVGFLMDTLLTHAHILQCALSIHFEGRFELSSLSFIFVDHAFHWTSPGMHPPRPPTSKSNISLQTKCLVK